MHKSNGEFLNEDFDLKVYTDSPRCVSDPDLSISL